MLNYLPKEVIKTIEYNYKLEINNELTSSTWKNKKFKV